MEAGHVLTSQPLIGTLIASIVCAFVFGLIAKRLRIPTIMGYLVAGVLIGPHTPGFVADIELASELAEIGVILLMFGVGLHFSLKDLANVQRIAVPGALFQMAVATFVGALFICLQGASIAQGITFGLVLSVASTVVLLRTLEQRGLLKSNAGRTAVGWLLIEDIAMVLVLVLLPVLGDEAMGGGSIDRPWEMVLDLVLVVVKMAFFAAAMILLGRKFLPSLLVWISKSRSRELAALGTLAIALGFAWLAHTMFEASMALGAFLAGLVLRESEIGQKSAENTVPLRDVFTVIFFVSVGMLFDPGIVVRQPLAVLGVVAVIVVGKSLAAYAIMRTFNQPPKASLLVSVSLAQIGEFSFILAGVGRVIGLITPEMYDLVLAGALLSIALNSLLFRALGNFLPQPESK